MARPARTFGVTTTLSGTLGAGIIANSMTKSDTVEVAEARNEVGTLLDLAPYSQNREISIDGLYIGSGPAVGEVASIDGKDWLISEVSKTESNEAFQECSVTARAGDEDTVIHSLSAIQALAPQS